jgi:N-glycosylase/DNA lyase
MTALVPCRTSFEAPDYDLAATLDCGQAFRWTERNGAWEGVLGTQWVRLGQLPGRITAETFVPAAATPACDWGWLARYLQVGVDLELILASLPDDPPMRAALTQCRGLRLLRQDPWECLASFILSSTKQIVQIRQIIAQLCERFGGSVVLPPGHPPAFSFPSATRLAQCSEAELRACKMGFRAPNLLQVARLVADGHVPLDTLSALPLDEARRRLVELPGVGPKIADCVLLFACGFPNAFPVDVWVAKALRALYFPRRRPTARRLREFISTHFGPHAGYAQQYLFHSARLRAKAVPACSRGRLSSENSHAFPPRD